MRTSSTIHMKACLFSLPHWLYKNCSWSDGTLILQYYSKWLFHLHHCHYCLSPSLHCSCLQSFCLPHYNPIFSSLPSHVTPLLKNHQCFFTDYRIKSSLLSMTSSSFPSRSPWPHLPHQVLYDPLGCFIWTPQEFHPLMHLHILYSGSGLVTKSYPTLCISMGCSPPGSSVHRISLARILEWVAISFSRGSSRPRDQTCVSCIGRWILYCRITREVPHIFCCFFSFSVLGKLNSVFQFLTQKSPPLNTHFFYFFLIYNTVTKHHNNNKKEDINLILASLVAQW